MSMFYTPNKSFVSGEQGQAYSKRAYNLLRAGHGYYSGEEIGSILYSHYVLGKSINVINLENKTIPLQIIKGTLTGSFSPQAFNAFFELLEQEPKQLDKLFGAVNNG